MFDSDSLNTRLVYSHLLLKHNLERECKNIFFSERVKYVLWIAKIRYRKMGKKCTKLKIKVYSLTRNTWTGDPASGFKFQACNLVEGI